MRTWEDGVHVRFVDEPKKEQVAEPKAAATSSAPAPTPTPSAPPPGPVISWQVGKFPARSLIRATPDPAKIQLADGKIWDKEKVARDAVAKFESTTPGKWLLDTLVEMFLDAKTRTYTTKIQLLFVDTIAFNADGDTLGNFVPARAGASEYTVEVINYQKPEGIFLSAPEFIKLTDAGGQDKTKVYAIRCFESWPGTITAANKASSRRLCFVDDAVAMMAETMFHELLHVWFVNGGADLLRKKSNRPPVARRFPTGHGKYALGEYEEDFHDQITPMIDELNGPHQEALKQFEASHFNK